MRNGSFKMFPKISVFSKCSDIKELIFNHLESMEKVEFANSPGDRGSIPGRVIPKTQKKKKKKKRKKKKKKKALDATLLNTQHYKVRIKGKVEQSREWSCTLPLHLGVAAIEKGAFGSPSTMVSNFTFIICNMTESLTQDLRPMNYPRKKKKILKEKNN